MKNINRSTIATFGFLMGFLACSEPELPNPQLYTIKNAFKANFTFANATVDAPSMDFYVNGAKLGAAAPGIALPLYTSIPIASSGATGSATANTSIRTKGTTGVIGGKVGSSDLIFRATSNGTGNFASLNNANYTVIAVDFLERPVPKRLNRFTATISFADVTYWNPNTSSTISASRRDSLNPVNCPACVDQTTSTATEFANLVSQGLVPLGLTDVGGVRFYVAQDVPPTFTAATVVTSAGIRFVNCIVNSNNITAAANANGTFGGPPVYARLNAGAPHTLTNVGPPNATNAFVASVPGGLSPNAGSRSAGNLVFPPPFVIAVAGVPNAYTLQLATDGAFTNIVYSAPVTFNPGRSYTIFARGSFTSLTGIQPGISHGIITH